MGITRDNKNNLEEENLTFFLDDSRKLNEFVLNKQTIADIPGSDKQKGNITTNIISDNQTLKELDQKSVFKLKSSEDKDRIADPNDQYTKDKIVDSNLNYKSESVTNSSLNSDSGSTSNSSSP